MRRFSVLSCTGMNPLEMCKKCLVLQGLDVKATGNLKFTWVTVRFEHLKGYCEM